MGRDRTARFVTTRPIHFVGSIPLDDAEAVFRAIAGTVGAAAPRWPDGETGARSQWIRWQKQTFEDHSCFELIAAHNQPEGYKDDIRRPVYILCDDADAAIETMGYAAEAIRSYAVLRA